MRKQVANRSVHDSEIAGSRTCRLATFQSQFRRPASPRHTISTCVYRIYTRQQPQSPNRLRASTNKLSMSRRRLVQLNRRRKRQLVACGAAWCLQAGHVHNSTCPCLRCQITRRAKLTKNASHLQNFCIFVRKTHKQLAVLNCPVHIVYPLTVNIQLFNCLLMQCNFTV